MYMLRNTINYDNLPEFYCNELEIEKCHSLCEENSIQKTKTKSYIIVEYFQVKISQIHLSFETLTSI